MIAPDSYPPPLPADRRWHQAVDLVITAGDYFRPAADAAIAAAKRFYWLLRHCRHDRDHEILAERMPVMHAAFQIYQAGGPVRHALEARLLTGGSAAAIARQVGMHPDLVRCYGQVFYDVVPWLRFPGHVMHQVLGQRLHAGAWTYDLVWKFFAYVGGSRVLDAIMATVPETAKPASAADVAVFLSAHASAAVRWRIAAAAQALAGSDPGTATALLRLQAQSTKKADGETIPANIIEQHIGALMKELPWVFGIVDDAKLPPGVGAADRSPVELRDDELLRVSSGIPLPEDTLALLETGMLPPRSPGSQPAAPGNQGPAAAQPAPGKGVSGGQTRPGQTPPPTSHPK